MQENRQTAYKFWIADIVSGNYIQPQIEGEVGHLLVQEKEVYRVNILAPVIAVEKRENISIIILDDGSATLQVRAFKEDAGMLQGLQIGDLVMIVGKVREYLGAIYVIPDIVKKLESPKWMIVRKLELNKLYGPRDENGHQNVVAPVSSLQQMQNDGEKETQKLEDKNSISNQAESAAGNPRQKILQEVGIAGDEGINVDVLITRTQLQEQQAEDIITELLKEGEIYMSRPGRLKIV